MRRILKTKYKNLKGIVVPEGSHDDLAFLSTEGKAIPILKNEKYQFLKNLIWESMSVFGKLVKKSDREYLEVIFFSLSPPSDVIKRRDTYEMETETA